MRSNVCALVCSLERNKGTTCTTHLRTSVQKQFTNTKNTQNTQMYPDGADSHLGGDAHARVEQLLPELPHVVATEVLAFEGQLHMLERGLPPVQNLVHAGVTQVLQAKHLRTNGGVGVIIRLIWFHEHMCEKSIVAMLWSASLNVKSEPPSFYT